MNVSVIPIGNSKGIRLSKTMLEKYHITDSVELVLEEDGIKIIPTKSPRKGWKEAFKKMAQKGDDKLLISDVFEEDSFEPWK